MDEHLDTSWCPVCDKLILPRRYAVAIEPPPQPPALAPPPLTRQPSGRGKAGGNANAHLKALARNHGGGLLHGTGRIRPGGGLKRNASTSNMVPTLQQQQPAPAIPIAARERIVIDQGQTPLYCSEECRKADLELANIPLSRSAPMDFPVLQHQLGTHQFQLNAAVASPPPPAKPNPILQPVQLDSSRSASNGQTTRSGLHLSLSEVENSDSSLTAMSNYATSDASQTSPETEEQKTLTEGEGLQGVSAQLQKLLVNAEQTGLRTSSTAPAFQSLSVNSSVDRSPPKSSGNVQSPISPTSPAAKARAKSAIELYAKYPLFSKSRSTSRSASRQNLNLTAAPTVSGSYTDAYAISSTSPSSITQMSPEQVASLPQSPVSPSTQDIPAGFENLAKLYAGRKLSTRHTEPRSILAKGAEGKLLVPNVKLKPLGPDIGYGSAPTSGLASARLGRTASGGGGDTPQVQREGRVASVRNMALRRDASDPGVRRESVRSPLGSVQEEAGWPRKGKALERQGSASTHDAESEGESEAASASAAVSRRSSRKGSESGRRGREGLKLHERGRLNMQGEHSLSFIELNISCNVQRKLGRTTTSIARLTSPCPQFPSHKSASRKSSFPTRRLLLRASPTRDHRSQPLTHTSTSRRCTCTTLSSRAARCASSVRGAALTRAWRGGGSRRSGRCSRSPSASGSSSLAVGWRARGRVVGMRG